MSIRCVVVTPERTEIDTEADSIVLPMVDGELGVMSNRAPMIGRLGYGTLTLKGSSGEQRYYIDGGFAQVENNVVNILTSRAIPVADLNRDDAQQSLDEALSMPSETPEKTKLKHDALSRARGQLRSVR